MLYTQVHCIRADRVLLMLRNKEPNLGLWVAPGGKIELDEAPYECAARELREETGLQAHELLLQGIISVVMPALEQPCLQFLYAVPVFSGQLKADRREGELRWWHKDELCALDMPNLNHVYLPRLLDLDQPFYQARFTYDRAWQLLQVAEHTLTIAGAEQLLKASRSGPTTEQDAVLGKRCRRG
jgi:8-oxo-dGTP diphosphatase